MGMGLHLTTISIALLLLFLVHSPLASSFPLNITINDDAPSAYEVLQSYNFPVGILPKGVVKYDLDESTGRFHAYFGGSCSFSLVGSYQLKYKSTISGVISENRLKDLSGITVKVLFLWLNIVEVTRDGDELGFSVGIASASFPLDNFYESPQCGCGFSCANGKTHPDNIICGFGTLLREAGGIFIPAHKPILFFKVQRTVFNSIHQENFKLVVVAHLFSKQQELVKHN